MYVTLSCRKMMASQFIQLHVRRVVHPKGLTRRWMTHTRAQGDIVLDTPTLNILRRPVGPFAMNEYIIQCKRTKKAAIVDSGEDPSVFFARYAVDNSLDVTHLLQTHGHIDHVTGLVATKNKYPDALIHLHMKELVVYNKVSIMALMLGMDCETPLPPVDVFVEDMEQFHVGDINFNVLLTPGHTPGHCIYYHNSTDMPFAFVGDLIFEGSVGRTDLPGANQDQMVVSIRKLVKSLPEKTVLFPGHMNSTTMGQEIQCNPYVKMWNK